MKNKTKKILIITILTIAALFMTQATSRAVNKTYDAQTSANGKTVTITFTIGDNFTEEEDTKFAAAGWNIVGGKSISKDVGLYAYAYRSEQHEEGSDDYTVQYGTYAFPIEVAVNGTVTGLESTEISIADTSIAEKNSEGAIVGKKNGKTTYTVSVDDGLGGTLSIKGDVIVGTGTPDEPTPDEPTPDEPTPDEPTPDEPTPDEPTPDEPTPDEPTQDEPTQDEPSTDEPSSDGSSSDKDNDSSNSSNSSSSKTKNGDGTTSNKVLSKTGEGFTIIFVIMGVAFVAVRARIKDKKNKIK